MYLFADQARAEYEPGERVRRFGLHISGVACA
jgi:hypothetical protein